MPLSLRHLWMTAHGRLVILEFPAEITEMSTPTQPSWPVLPRIVARLCLEGAEATTSATSPAPPRVAIPGRARAFLSRLFQEPLDLSHLSHATEELRELSRSHASVSPSVRSAHLVCAWFLPVVVAVGAFMGALATIQARWQGGGGIADAALSVMTSLEIGIVVLGLFALPALASAYLFRGGPFLRLFGLEVQRKDGEPASRLRCLFRAFVACLPLLALGIPVWILAVVSSEVKMPPGMVGPMPLTRAADGATWGVGAALARGIAGLSPIARNGGVFAALCMALVFLAGVVVSAVRPARSFQDRIAGTTLMPR